jgi:hypothetical protein
MKFAALIVASLICGTSPEMHERTLALDARVRATTRLAALAQKTTRVADHTLFVRADAETAPFDDPADLEGISLYFARRGPNTFAVSREALRYDDDTGPQFVAFDRATSAKVLALPFAFPFGAGAYDEVTLSVVRGIHFTARPILPARNVEALELITGDPLISPLLDYQDSPGGRPQVFVKQTAEAVTITFRRELPSPVDFDIQAVLYASGDIRFSYKTVRNIAWGGAVVSTGAGSWMSETTPVAAIADPAGDVEPLFGASREMLDIRSVDIARVAGSSLLELRIRTAAAIDGTVLREGSSYLVFLGDSLNRVELFVFADRLLFRLPNGTEATDSPMARIDGSDVVMYVPEDQLTLGARNGVKVWAYTNAFSVADSATFTLDLGSPPPSLETDFSAIASVELSRPLVETYRLPAVNVQGVWRRLQQELGYRDEDIDAVAIYTSFFSDIILTRYGAFATLANPGADGISQYSSKSQPRTPTLMHMNATFAAPGEAGTSVLLHELGHRWLYYFDVVEDGAKRRALNPLGYHPAQWVHTPGAFLNDSSTMGGGVFTDNGNGTFSTAPSAKLSAYTWHELYLMGLARPEEVQPWFYLRGTTLGDEYHPPFGATVTGTRVDVNVQQLIAAMGPRDPSFASSQKTFRVLFVVLERDGAPATFPAARRIDFENAFSAATGGRGRVVTAIPGRKRRAVGPLVVGVQGRPATTLGMTRQAACSFR